MTQNSWPGAHGGGWGGAPQWGGPPPAAPRPGVIPLRPLALGDIITGSFATVRAHWKTLAGVVLAVQAVVLPVMALVVGIAFASVHQHFDPVFDPPFGEDPAAEHLVPLVVAAVVVFVLLMVIGVLGVSVTAALCPAVLREAVMGRPTSFRALWRSSVRRAPAVAGAMFLSGLIAGAPVFLVLAAWLPLVFSAGSGEGAVALLGFLPLLMLAAAPLAVWLGIRFGLAPAVVVLEGAGPVTGLRRSAALVRGDWWRIFGYTLVAGMLAGAIAYAIQIPFNLIGTFAMMPVLQGIPEHGTPSAGAVAAAVFAVVLLLLGGAAGQVFQIGFSHLASAMLYVDQRMRREGLAEAILADLAAPAPATPPAAATDPAAPRRPAGDGGS
ncbi:DUF7847 domain-containing protein [Streptomyces vinaceus]|uniref:DUF7847 domain-containing protein n=1 Tax=Streptomyces vinaceus TaxID=1960 RepID=UPI00123DAC5B|nr:hypothetical protein [Streptomyces vinaceus]GHE74763.1 hypothetical protein GCM10017778_70410 [Streptomyces vinaceus]